MSLDVQIVTEACIVVVMSNGEKCKTYFPPGTPAGVLHDALQAAKGVVVQKMVEAQQAEQAEAEEKMKPEEAKE